MSGAETSDARPLVLVVEDDADLRAYLAHSLRHLARVAEASNGLDALAVLAAEPVSLVVTDLVMPRMDGLALCHAMQADPSLASIPVIVITGETGDEVPGACGTLLKPFNARALHQHAAAHLRAAAPPRPAQRHAQSDVPSLPSPPNS